MTKLKHSAEETVESRVTRIADILDDLKAEDIIALDLRGISDFTDFFVIATMRSATQMRATAEQLYRELKTQGLRPFAPTEYDSPHWLVLDYSNVVVHLFDADTRKHYALEELWGDAAEFEWQNQATA